MYVPLQRVYKINNPHKKTWLRFQNDLEDYQNKAKHNTEVG